MSLFEQYVKTNRKLPPELLQTLAGIEEPSALADTIAAPPGRAPGRQAAPAGDARYGERLEMLVGFVDGEIDVQQMESASAAA
jgi:ATP-dependent Lon protease